MSTLLIIYSTVEEDSNTVSDSDLNDDEEEGEQLLEYVELSEYEKRREERIAARRMKFLVKCTGVINQQASPKRRRCMQGRCVIIIYYVYTYASICTYIHTACI